MTEEKADIWVDSVAVTGNGGVLIASQRSTTPTNNPPTAIRPTRHVSA
ncbi:MAG: hypothetical protein U1F83_06570 [Verrucomicrobiota bacterium]